MLERSLTLRVAAKHASEVPYPIVALEFVDPGRRFLALGFLRDEQVVIGECCDLWQVRDDEDLVVSGNRFEALRHLAPDDPADPGVDLVEY